MVEKWWGMGRDWKEWTARRRKARLLTAILGYSEVGKSGCVDGKRSVAEERLRFRSPALYQSRGVRKFTAIPDDLG